MIEINLLPGDGKKKRRANTTSGAVFQFQPSQWFAGISEKITDKYLIGAIGACAFAVLVIGFLLSRQGGRARLAYSYR